MSRDWPADAPLGAPARPKIAVPGSDQLHDLDPAWLLAFERTAARLERAGAELVPIDLEPYLDAARMMYQSAFVAERYAAVGEFVSGHPESVDPTVRSIIEAAGEIPAHRLTSDLERLDRLRLEAGAALGDADALLLPTTTHHPLIEEVRADPIGVNSRLGTYTNFCNLLDLCAIAVPSGERVDGDSVGVSVIVRAFADRVAGDIAALLGDGVPPGEPVRPAFSQRTGPTGIGLVVSSGVASIPVYGAGAYGKLSRS
jgi:allophanate hydrolase